MILIHYTDIKIGDTTIIFLVLPFFISILAACSRSPYSFLNKL